MREICDPAVQERFWRHVETSGDSCWDWRAARNRGGYGLFNVDRGYQMAAHRVAFITTRGPLAANVVLDHLCRRPSCCNPAHLDAVSQRENVLRGDSPAAWNFHKRVCPRGHPYNVDNTYQRPSGGRSCRACRRLWMRRRRQAAALGRGVAALRLAPETCVPTPGTEASGDTDARRLRPTALARVNGSADERSAANQPCIDGDTEAGGRRARP